MAVSKGLRHRTLSAATAAELRRRIMDGDLPSGAALRQDALAQEFGISRIPLREAFLQLEAEGLLRILPHRGAVVSELSAEDIDEVFELRLLLEPRLLESSAPALTEEDYADLRRILEEYGAAIEVEDVSRWGQLNTDFHLKLYSRARQPRTIAFVSNLLQEGDRLTRIQLMGTRATARAQREHAELIALCAAGRVPEALSLLRVHIEDVRRGLDEIAAKARKAAAGGGAKGSGEAPADPPTPPASRPRPPAATRRKARPG